MKLLRHIRTGGSHPEVRIARAPAVAYASSMIQTYTHDTVPTAFVETAGTRFAYRRFGNPIGTPIVFTQHFLGNMDNFDSAITDPLSNGHEIVLFDNRGVGGSDGTAPETIGEYARDAGAFIEALGLSRVAVLGHSMGGEVAQMLAIERPGVANLEIVDHVRWTGIFDFSWCACPEWTLTDISRAKQARGTITRSREVMRPRRKRGQLLHIFGRAGRDRGSICLAVNGPMTVRGTWTSNWFRFAGP